MWVEPQKKKLDDGTEIITGYKFVKRYYNPKLGKNRTVSKTYKVNSPQARNKAEAALNKRIASILSGMDETSKTFKEMYSEYIKLQRPHWANATYIKNSGFYKRHIKGMDFENFLVDKITFSDVQSILDTVQYDKGLSVNTTVNVKSLIAKVLAYAEIAHGAKINIRLDKIKIKEPEDNGNMKYIESTDIPSVIKRTRELTGDLYGDAVEFQLLTGLRIGELIALNETDLDLDNNKLTINKSWDRTTGEIKPPKNKYSNRVIDTSARINEIFINRVAQNKVMFGDSSFWVFANKNNNVIVYTHLCEVLKKVNKEYTTHLMRHTHTCLLIEKGFDLKYIMQRLGHSNPETTLKVYSHVTNKMKEKGAEKLNNLF